MICSLRAPGHLQIQCWYKYVSTLYKQVWTPTQAARSNCSFSHHDEFNAQSWLLSWYHVVSTKLIPHGITLSNLLCALPSPFSCLHLCHSPVAYLMTLSNCLMSSQAWPPRACYGQWARCKHWRLAVHFLYKMACFNGIYLKYCQTNTAGISIWHKNNVFWYKI